jgi:hypothetical protein
MTTISRTTTQAKDQQILQGISTDLQTMSTLPLGATTYTPGSLAAFIQSRIDAANAVNTTRASWLAAVKTYEAINTQAKAVVSDLRYLVMGAFGPTSPKLADFGFSPPKQATQTQEAKAAAAQKRAATRKARRTLGKRQKAKIKGSSTAASKQS